METGEYTQSCEIWLMEAQKMANRARKAENGGLGYLCDTSKPYCSRDMVSFSANSNPKYDTCEESGFLKHAFILTFYYLLLVDGQKKDVGKLYRAVVEEIISLGGDTDTNACIVGGLIGAYVGVQNLDRSMLKIFFKFDCQDRSIQMSDKCRRPDWINLPKYVLTVISQLIKLRAREQAEIVFLDDKKSRRNTDKSFMSQGTMQGLVL